MQPIFGADNEGTQMSISLQVFYPTDGDTTFDHEYFTSSHMTLVGEHMGPFIESTLVIKGLAGGPDVPPGFHVVNTLIFSDQSALDQALAAAGPVLADIKNYFNGEPQMLIGSVAT